MNGSLRPHHASAPAPAVAPAIRTLIVDDEPLARLRLRTLLAEHADFAVVGECGDGREAMDAIARARPDLLFLDVQMAEVNGLEVARAVEHASAAAGPLAIVFVTAFDQYAVRAFEVSALDYLLKPFDEERFVATLDRVRAHRANGQTREAHARLLGVLRDLSRGDAAASGGTADGAAPRDAATLRVADLEVDVRGRVRGLGARGGGGGGCCSDLLQLLQLRHRLSPNVRVRSKGSVASGVRGLAAGVNSPDCRARCRASAASRWWRRRGSWPRGPASRRRRRGGRRA